MNASNNRYYIPEGTICKDCEEPATVNATPKDKLDIKQHQVYLCMRCWTKRCREETKARVTKEEYSYRRMVENRKNRDPTKPAF